MWMINTPLWDFDICIDWGIEKKIKYYSMFVLVFHRQKKKTKQELNKTKNNKKQKTKTNKTKHLL